MLLVGPQGSSGSQGASGDRGERGEAGEMPEITITNSQTGVSVTGTLSEIEIASDASTVKYKLAGGAESTVTRDAYVASGEGEGGGR